MESGVNLIAGVDVEPENIEWLWKDYIPRDMTSILAGQGSAGKTTFMMYAAAVVTRGGHWPDGTPAPEGNVLICSSEDGIADTLMPRLLANNVNRQRIHFLDDMFEQGNRRRFDWERDLPKLEKKIEEIGNVALVIIDPIIDIISGDMNKVQVVRRGLYSLFDFAKAQNAAIVGITHVTKKSKGKDPVDRITGSGAWVHAVRNALLAVRIESGFNGHKDSSVLVRAKTNIGPIDDGWVYHITPCEINFKGKLISTTRVVWETEPIRGSAKEIIRMAEGDDSSNQGIGVELNRAIQFLRNILASGARRLQEIQTMAKSENISDASLKRGKQELKVRTKKIAATIPGDSPYFTWSLPDKSSNVTIWPSATQPMSIASAFEQYTNPYMTDFAPYAPGAPGAPGASVVQPKWDALLESALQLAIAQARNQLARVEIDPGEEAIEDAIFNLEIDVTDGLIDDPDKLALLRNRLRSTNWWQGIPLKTKLII